MNKGGMDGLIQGLPLGPAKTEDPVGMILTSITKLKSDIEADGDHYPMALSGSDFEKIQKPQVAQLAAIMKSLLKKLDYVLERPPYNFIIHNSPMRFDNLLYYHWHIELMPKLVRTGGFEWGTGFYICPVPPEESAQFLRETKA